MWPFRKTARQRRLETRRPPRAGEPAWIRFCRAGGIGGLLLGLLLYLAAAVLDLWPAAPFPYRLGQYLAADVHARLRFRMPLAELIENARGRAIRQTPAVYQFDAAVPGDVAAALKQILRRLGTATQPAEPNVPPSPWRALADDPNALKVYHEQVGRIAEELPRAYLIRRRDAEEHKPLLRWPERVLLRGPESPAERDVDEVPDVGKKEAVAAEADRLAAAVPPPFRKDVASQLAALLAGSPVYRYDPIATQGMMDQAVARVEANPPDDAYREYAPGERIAQRSVRRDAKGARIVMGLTPQELEVLQVEHGAYRTDQRAVPLKFWSRIAGRAALLLLAVVLLAIYVVRYQPRLPKDHLRSVALLIFLAAMLGLQKLLSGLLGLNPQVVVLPALMSAVVLAIAWDQRVALAVASAVAILLVFQARSGIELFLVLLVGLAAAIYQLGEVRTRTKLIRVGAVTGVVVFAASWADSLATAVPWEFALREASWAGGSALLVGFVAQGLLPLIERAFRVATSLTLLEWCDASKPLLKRLAMEAPGTYNHSLQLGALCEAAAEAIGARGLLARVGAYYHDIGKINKPDYFVENQLDMPSKHAKLSPAMSLLIIIGHVKDGIELAREYGLPTSLYEFITTHHGTTLVQYFYHAAAEQRRADAERAPDEVEFRYPGPKPLSKEPAILMLADAAESSLRAMAEPTPGRIENQVHAIINRRLMDGQLDECDLTLREVHQIEESLIKGLCSMHHARIAYPTPAGQRPSAGELHPRQANGAPAAARSADGPDRPDGQSEQAQAT